MGCLTLFLLDRLWSRGEHQSKEEFLEAIQAMRDESPKRGQENQEDQEDQGGQENQDYWPGIHKLNTESEDEAVNLYREASDDSDREEEPRARKSPAAPPSPTPPRRYPTPEIRLATPPATESISPTEPKTPVRKRPMVRRHPRVPPRSIPSDSEEEARPRKVPRPLRSSPPPVEASDALEDAIATKNRLARGHEQTSPRMGFAKQRPTSLLTTSKGSLVSLRRDGRVEPMQPWISTTLPVSGSLLSL